MHEVESNLKLPIQHVLHEILYVSHTKKRYVFVTCIVCYVDGLLETSFAEFMAEHATVAAFSQRIIAEYIGARAAQYEATELPT